MRENSSNEVICLNKKIVKEEIVEYLDHDYLGYNFFDKDKEGPEQLICNICAIEMPQSKVQQHMEDEHFKFKCSQCTKKYYTESQLRKHLGRSHLESMNLKCPFCPMVLTRKYNYKQHVYTHSSTALFTCSFENCGKSFRHVNTFKQHKRIHENRHRRECPICHDHVTRLQTHVLTHSNDRPYVCDQCGNGYLMKKHLDNHKTTHVAEGHKCQVCNRIYKSAGSLYRHMRSIHSGTNHDCPECGQSYSRRDNMVSHLKRVHGDAASVASRSKLDAGHSGND